jgi:hypothetical protein
MLFSAVMLWRGVFRMQSLIAVALTILTLVPMFAFFFEDAYEAWIYRATLGTGDGGVFDRVEFLFMEMGNMFDVAGFLGYGIGATHNAAGYLTGYSDTYAQNVLSLAEGEPARILLEMGPVGFAAIYASRLAAIAVVLGSLGRITDSFGITMCGVTAALMLVLLPAQQAINPTLGPLIYGMFGACLAYLMQEERARESLAGLRLRDPALRFAFSRGD